MSGVDKYCNIYTVVESIFNVWKISILKMRFGMIAKETIIHQSQNDVDVSNYWSL